MVIYAALALPISAEKSAGIEMKSFDVCPIDLTELGRKVAFSGSAVYQVVSNSQGAVTDVVAADVKSLPRYVDLHGFEVCMRRWQFGTEGHYTVVLDVGTKGDFFDRWDIKITAPGKTLSITLPGCAVR
jgi:hypothetical protein